MLQHQQPVCARQRAQLCRDTGAKVERLQKRISEAKKRRKSSLSMLEVASPVTPLSRSSAFEATDKRRDRRLRFKQELTCIDELVSDFGFLYVPNLFSYVVFLFADSYLQNCQCNS